MREFPQVVALAKAHGIDRVMPGRLILEGGGRTCADQALSDAEWETFLKENGVKMPPFPPHGRGRGPGNRPGHFVIMAGGEFRPNRRGPAIGHWPEEEFDALIGKLTAFRDGDASV